MEWLWSGLTTAVVAGIAGAQVECPLFPGETFAAGQFTRGVAPLDLNGDGLPDLVTADDRAETVSIRLSDGKGGYLPRIAYSAGEEPVAVCGGDFDGDGDADVAIADADSEHALGSVLVYENTGQGALSAPIGYKVGRIPSAVVAIDLDDDGDLDLVTANEGESSVSVLLGAGDGTFSPQVEYTAGGSPSGLFVADMGGDEKPDLAVPNTLVDTFSSLLNDGDGTFGPKKSFAVGDGPSAITGADVGGDGDIDLIVANAEAGTISIFENLGGGIFGSQVVIDAGGTGAEAVGAADLDGDGDPDLMMMGGQERFASVFHNSGGEFGPARVYESGGMLMDLVMVDLDGDGDLDGVAPDLIGDQTRIFRNRGDGTFPASESLGPAIARNDLGSADLDGDGDPDLHAVFGDQDCWCHEIHLNQGDGTFVTSGTYYAAAYPNAVTSGDVDGDGDLDLVSANTFGNIFVALNNGDATFEYPVGYLSTEGPVDLALADVNEDGHLDIIVANSGDYDFDCECNVGSAVGILLGAGDGTFGPVARFAEGTQPHAVAVGDINGDDHLDIVAGHGAKTAINTLLGDGKGGFGPPIPTGGGKSPTRLLLADLDGDGDLDAASADGGNQSAKFTVYLNSGGTLGGGATRSIDATGTNLSLQDIDAADLDGDGDLDLAVTVWSKPRVVVLLNDGQGKFADELSFDAGQGKGSTLADLDGDGRIDLAVAGPARVSVLLNTGGTLEVVEHPQDVLAETGGKAAFEVEAKGPGGLEYQWRKDGAALEDDGRISGAATPVLTIDPVEPGDAGQYDARVIGACGPVFGGPAALVVGCAADCDGSGDLTLFDFLCYVNLFNENDPAADCDDDGVLTLFDFLCFVNDFNTGC
jgi:hypothetical protein